MFVNGLIDDFILNFGDVYFYVDLVIYYEKYFVLFVDCEGLGGG